MWFYNCKISSFILLFYEINSLSGLINYDFSYCYDYSVLQVFKIAIDCLYDSFSNFNFSISFAFICILHSVFFSFCKSDYSILWAFNLTS